jgi:hypothetical protein
LDKNLIFFNSISFEKDLYFFFKINLIEFIFCFLLILNFLFFRLLRQFEEKKYKEYLEKNPRYFEFILPNGFYMYFLIQYYYEADESLDEPIIRMLKKANRSKVRTDFTYIE